MQLTPNKTDFLRLAAEHSLIPVHVDLPVDLETPVSLYYKIVGDEPGFMLESAETSKNFGRYSFIKPFRGKRRGLHQQLGNSLAASERKKHAG